MKRKNSIEIFKCNSHAAGFAFFSDPLVSNETLVAEVQPRLDTELFCHRNQTDQLMVLRGSLDLIILQNRQLQRIHLMDTNRLWVKIPPNIPHAAMNRSGETVLMVNAVLRHGPVDPRDYKPRPIPHCLQEQWNKLLNP